MKIALIGTYPPPIGGTSIHIMRLREKLVEKGFTVSVYDTPGKGFATFAGFYSVKNYKKWLVIYCLKIKEDIIHSHTHEWKERAVLSVAAKVNKKKSVFTFHSLRDEWDKLSKFEKICVKCTFKNADLFICTSKYIKNKLISWKCPIEKIKVINPFILPSKNEINVKVPEYIQKFRKNHEYIIVANASNNNHYKNADLYGLDMCVELVQFLKDKGVDVGILFAQTKITNKEYFIDIKQRIKNKNISNDILIVTENMSFIPILNIADIFIRPTNTDSWAMSLSEALSMGKPSIASDASERELGTIVFQNRNQEEFNEIVIDTINDLSFAKQNLEKIKISDDVEKVINVYYELFQK